MGIPCKCPAYISGDNQYVLANTTIPNSTPKKKSQSIVYHFIRERSSQDEWRTSYVNTNENEANLLTKQFPSGEKRKGFFWNLLHDIFQTKAPVAYVTWGVDKEHDGSYHTQKWQCM